MSEEKIQHPASEYFGRINDSYPGLRVWFHLSRGANGFTLLVFDKNRSDDGPIYLWDFSDETMKSFSEMESKGQSQMLPGFSAAGQIMLNRLGCLPPGVK